MKLSGKQLSAIATAGLACLLALVAVADLHLDLNSDLNVIITGGNKLQIVEKVPSGVTTNWYNGSELIWYTTNTTWVDCSERVALGGRPLTNTFVGTPQLTAAANGFAPYYTSDGSYECSKAYKDKNGHFTLTNGWSAIAIFEAGYADSDHGIFCVRQGPTQFNECLPVYTTDDSNGKRYITVYDASGTTSVSRTQDDGYQTSHDWVATLSRWSPHTGDQDQMMARDGYVRGTLAGGGTVNTNAGWNSMMPPTTGAVVVGAIEHGGGWSFDSSIAVVALYDHWMNWTQLTDACNWFAYHTGLQTRWNNSLSGEDFILYSKSALAMNGWVEDWGWKADNPINSTDWPANGFYAAGDSDRLWGTGWKVFNGLSDHLKGASSAHNLHTGHVDRCDAFWLKRDISVGLSGWEYIYAYGGAGNGEKWLIFQGTNIVIGINANGTTAYVTNGAPGAIYDTNWHSYAVCYDESVCPSNTIAGVRFFQDGREMTDIVRTGTGIEIDTGLSQPAWGWNWATIYWAGSIGEWNTESRCWNETLATNYHTNATAVVLFPGI